MSAIDERRERASAGVALNHDPDAWYGDFANPRVCLQPIAAPPVLGLFGFAGATFVVAANMAGWGDPARVGRAGYWAGSVAGSAAACVLDGASVIFGHGLRFAA